LVAEIEKRLVVSARVSKTPLVTAFVTDGFESTVPHGWRIRNKGIAV
jgi:hypothetical protein